MSHQKEAGKESGTSNVSWEGDERSLVADRVNHVRSTNDLRAFRASQTGKKGLGGRSNGFEIGKDRARVAVPGV